jgi:hypothetical protein
MNAAHKRAYFPDHTRSFMFIQEHTGPILLRLIIPRHIPGEVPFGIKFNVFPLAFKFCDINGYSVRRTIFIYQPRFVISACDRLVTALRASFVTVIRRISIRPVNARLMFYSFIYDVMKFPRAVTSAIDIPFRPILELIPYFISGDIMIYKNKESVQIGVSSVEDTLIHPLMRVVDIFFF